MSEKVKGYLMMAPFLGAGIAAFGSLCYILGFLAMLSLVGIAMIMCLMLCLAVIGAGKAGLL